MKRRRPMLGTLWRSTVGTVLIGTAGLASSACAPSQGENALPKDIPDPTTVQTEGGTLAFYRRVVATTPLWLEPMVVRTGVLTDELNDRPVRLFDANDYTLLDSRTGLNAEATYNALHRVRAQAREARGFAASYLRDTVSRYSKRALQGHLYALEGYAEIFLAELFCSGIPLSTVDYGADYTLTVGFRTEEVYRHAAALLDTAFTLLADSARLQPLAQVGRGRALLGAGDYAGAVAAVTGVADNYQYTVTLVPTSTTPSELQRLFVLQFYHNPDNSISTEPAYVAGYPGVGEQEGGNGLPYRSSADPRVPVTLLGPDARNYDTYFPAKYPLEGAITYVLASGIEARLIEAEAALQSGGDWRTILNALRTDGTYTLGESGDTLWHAGTGGVPGLAPLADPGSAAARVSLVFRERAFWLYLTAHRQGDLRRLIRQYSGLGYTSETVYPTGSYQGGRGAYGTEVVFPVPASEAQLNPKYTGCIDHI